MLFLRLSFLPFFFFLLLLRPFIFSHSLFFRPSFHPSFILPLIYFLSAYLLFSSLLPSLPFYLLPFIPTSLPSSLPSFPPYLPTFLSLPFPLLPLKLSNTGASLRDPQQQSINRVDKTSTGCLMLWVSFSFFPESSLGNRLGICLSLYVSSFSVFLFFLSCFLCVYVCLFVPVCVRVSLFLFKCVSLSSLYVSFSSLYVSLSSSVSVSCPYFCLFLFPLSFCLYFIFIFFLSTYLYSCLFPY